MFGYVICDKNGLEPEEITRYRSLYCGICLALKEYGQAERASLNYDMTFAAAMLSSLYEPEENSSTYRCVMHPFRNQITVDSTMVRYAADMTIALSYHKNLDDWLDEHDLKAKKYAESIKNSYLQIAARYPRQCRSIETSLDQLHRIEADPSAGADEAINAGGNLLTEIFVYSEDFWSGALRQFGYGLGRFIYLMDAVMDYKTDIRKNCYNPLLRMEKDPAEMDELLKLEIGRAAAIFETLPLVNDIHLLRNILYSGVWQQYDAAGFTEGRPSETNCDCEDGITQ